VTKRRFSLLVCLRVVAAGLLLGALAPPAAFAAGGRITLFADDFETSKGWKRNFSGTDTATAGLWERGDPESTSSNGAKQLGTTASGSNDLVTGRLAGSSATANDVDGGKTTITSPAISLVGGGDYKLGFKYYFAHDAGSSSDFFRVFVVGSSTVKVFEKLGSSQNVNAAWTSASVSLDAFAGQSIRIRIEAADGGSGNLVEAGVDDVSITALLAASPDLTVSFFEITGSQGCFSDAYHPVARAHVANVGAGDAGSFLVDLNGSRQSVGGLAAGGTVDVDFANWEGAIDSAKVTVDPTHLVAESNENNNALTSTNNGIPAPPSPCTTEIVGYYTQWSSYGRDFWVQGVETSGAADKLTVLNYAFGNVIDNKCSFGITMAGVGDANKDYQEVITAAHSVDGIADSPSQPLRGAWNQLRKQIGRAHV